MCSFTHWVKITIILHNRQRKLALILKLLRSDYDCFFSVSEHSGTQGISVHLTLSYKHTHSHTYTHTPITDLSPKQEAIKGNIFKELLKTVIHYRQHFYPQPTPNIHCTMYNVRRFPLKCLQALILFLELLKDFYLINYAVCGVNSSSFSSHRL